MTKLQATAAAALEGVLQDGMTLAVGGFGLSGIPADLIADSVIGAAQQIGGKHLRGRERRRVLILAGLRRGAQSGQRNAGKRAEHCSAPRKPPDYGHDRPPRRDPQAAPSLSSKRQAEKDARALPCPGASHAPEEIEGLIYWRRCRSP